MIAIVGLLLVGCVSAMTVRWSNPEVGFTEQTIQPIKIDCPRDEWNNNFEDFREGLISKEDMKIYVRSCKW